MGGLLFVSQAMLDGWAEQGKIDFVGNVMTLLAGDGRGRSYVLEPAVRFLKVLGADADPGGLLHKVKSAAQLRELGAEAVDDSCILGDTAYEVQPGFLAEAAALQAAATAPSERVAASAGPGSSTTAAPVAAGATPRASGSTAGKRPCGPLPRELAEKRKEAEALARFLLENIS
ncbi:hypothetical protein [Anaeromyxobacter oryzae]|uniref:Uncharacterized protein n=1 Tax=Anaeromyxobacter oryzae TaxID=2918170 RepID=A0ABM7WQL5_9BACT|nr:hypothetical protein [Anaeromyxobacter oryzae]BDG01754.1 hypothetical protein AMOR_07500 [Anaeromyxobacter oryzae]